MPSSSNLPTRREFIAQAALAASACALGTRAVAAGPQAVRYPIIVFSLPFKKLNPEDTADFVAECGYDGMECPVRGGGQVEPERASDDLPRYVEAMRKRGLSIPLAATDIVRLDQPHTETVLRTLSQQGVRRLRLGFQRYDLNKPLDAQVRNIAAALKDLAAACKDLGLQAGVQNHSGTQQVGAPVWDVYSMVQDLDPKHMGFCFDIAHATVEGGLSWPLQARLAEPFYSVVIVKDFLWKKSKGKWAPDWCPLGEGMVSPAFFDRLKQTAYEGPISQEYFYELGDRTRMATLMRRELGVLKEWLRDRPA